MLKHAGIDRKFTNEDGLAISEIVDCINNEEYENILPQVSENVCFIDPLCNGLRGKDLLLKHFKGYPKMVPCI